MLQPCMYLYTARCMSMRMIIIKDFFQINVTHTLTAVNNFDILKKLYFLNPRSLTLVDSILSHFTDHLQLSCILNS